MGLIALRHKALPSPAQQKVIQTKDRDREILKCENEGSILLAPHPRIEAAFAPQHIERRITE